MEGRHLIITGQVQGVGFRHHMVEMAQQLGATGWVRNRPDGAVEAEVFGTPEVIAALLKWACGGSPNAQVEHVNVEWVTGEYADFVQR